MTTFGIVLYRQQILVLETLHADLKNVKERTWILVSVFRRNHWGMGLHSSDMRTERLQRIVE